MRNAFCLFLLTLAGVAFIVLPEKTLGIPKHETQGVARLWTSTLELFAVPFCLLILGLTRNVLVLMANVVWGSWLLVISILFVAKIHEKAPEVSLYGQAFGSSVLIVALALFVFSAIRLLPKNFKIPPTEDPPLNPS